MTYRTMSYRRFDDPTNEMDCPCGVTHYSYPWPLCSTCMREHDLEYEPLAEVRRVARRLEADDVQ